jgi:hypothetical protein
MFLLCFLFLLCSMVCFYFVFLLFIPPRHTHPPTPPLQTWPTQNQAC